MKVTLSPRAEKSLKKLSKINQIAVAKKIRSIADSDKVFSGEKLKRFKNIFRVRVGDFRIVYKRRGKDVYIVLIGHRRDIYRLVSRLFG